MLEEDFYYSKTKCLMRQIHHYPYVMVINSVHVLKCLIVAYKNI